MSWQDYVDDQLLDGGYVTYAAIIGMDGSVWAKSGNFEEIPGELETIAENYKSTEFFQKNGIVFAGTKYYYISGFDRVMRGKKGKMGLHSMRTETAIVVATYDEPNTAQHIATIVEKLGEFLISYGY